MNTPLHIEEARKLARAKVPFLHQGRTKAGVDCAGTIMVAGYNTGRFFIDIPAYGTTPDRDQLRDALRQNLGDPRADKRDMEVGDVALIYFHREPHHVALIGDYVYGGFTLIHAYSGGPGHVIEHRLDDKWMSRIVEVYPWPA